MSLINLKKLLTSITLVLVLTTQVFATQGFRPWSPYQRDEFGGGARRTEGVYGTLEGVFFSFAPVKNIVVGDNSDATGGIREAFTGNTVITQTNTIDTNHLGAVTTLGTRVEIGNNRGHHGWSLGGYSTLGMSASIEMPNASMVINDADRVTSYSITRDHVYFNYLYNPGSPEHGFEVFPGGDAWGGVLMANPYGPTSLWGWFVTEWVYPLHEEWGIVDYIVVGGGTNPMIVPVYGWILYQPDSDWLGKLAPLPINFENTKVTTKIDHWVIDAVYTYRFHPCRLGNFDAFGGIRYMELDDSLRFLGEGSPWKGVSADSVTGNLSGTAVGVGSVLGNSDWRFEADNHIIAPQIGARWSKTNHRWTLSTEGRFFAGFNQQNLRSQGETGTHYSNLSQGIFSSTGPMNHLDYNIYPWAPIGLVDGARSFNHSAVHHAFSPGVELKINANWQLTSAVGITFGVTGMWVDEIARGSRINDYTIYNDRFFGLKDSGFTDSALMYGFNFGVTVNRF
ncbi:MAG: BBP7 family outer membrane beta-barrel protein [Planctomycetaceae bacterium]|nr:BBP7 family outer membrane beta-barrel protein [Planctomycetaceae bacterium]